MSIFRRMTNLGKGMINNARKPDAPDIDPLLDRPRPSARDDRPLDPLPQASASQEDPLLSTPQARRLDTSTEHPTATPPDPEPSSGDDAPEGPQKRTL